MKKFLLSISVIALLLVAACSSKKSTAETSDKIEGTISISGAFALYPLVNVWAQEFQKEYPDVRFNISAGGAGKGVADALGGAVDLGMVSRDISPEEQAKGAWWVSVTKDAVLPTISSQNPALAEIKSKGLTREELAGYFLKDGQKTWKSSGKKVDVFTRSDASGAAAVWAEYLGGKVQEELKGIAVFGDPGLAEAVKNNPLAIGFNNVIYVYDLNSGQKYPGIEVAPIDTNGNGVIDPEEDFYGDMKSVTAAIADGRYPSPPARELFLITKGKPTKPAVTAFLNWILEKGQAHVEANGYILLNEEIIQAQKAKLQP
jgi:phosphate transport system substrate-binding protein